MEDMPLLGKVDETLRRVCLQWVNAGSAEKTHVTEEKKTDREAAAAGENLDLFQSGVFKVR